MTIGTVSKRCQIWPTKKTTEKETDEIKAKEARDGVPGARDAGQGRD